MCSYIYIKVYTSAFFLSFSVVCKGRQKDNSIYLYQNLYWITYFSGLCTHLCKCKVKYKWFGFRLPTQIYIRKNPRGFLEKNFFFVLFCSALFLGLFWLDFPKSQPIEDHTWIIIFMTFTKPKESLADVLQNRCS